MHALTQLKAEKATLKARFDAKVAEMWRVESSHVDAKIREEIWRMRDNGAKISEIARAYGTTSRNTIYGILALKPDDLHAAWSASIVDYLTVEQSPFYEGAWRVACAEVPREMWTYAQMGGDAYEVIPTTYSAWLDIDKKTGNVSARGQNSDPKGPLHLEWARGKSNIRDILNTTEA